MSCPKCAGQEGQLLLGGLPTMGTELWCAGLQTPQYFCSPNSLWCLKTTGLHEQRVPAGNIAILGIQDSRGALSTATTRICECIFFGVVLCSHCACGSKTPTVWALEASKTPWLQNKELLQPQSLGFLRVNVVFIQDSDLALQPNPS